MSFMIVMVVNSYTIIMSGMPSLHTERTGKQHIFPNNNEVRICHVSLKRLSSDLKFKFALERLPRAKSNTNLQQ